MLRKSCSRAFNLLLGIFAMLAAQTFFSFSAFAQNSHKPELHQQFVELRRNWQLQSACKAEDKGEVISIADYPARGWLPTDVPSTVLAAQVANHLFEDPFFGRNLLKIPGMDYPIGKIYGYLPLTEGSPYRCDWWYRTEFPASFAVNQKVWLHFNGINYRANIWVNGKRIADSSQVAGAFRTYEFDITEHLHAGGRNAIAVETFAQTENDLGIDFLDWNPSPADKSMGLWRNVYLATSGPVTIRNPQVTTHFVHNDLSEAELTVAVDVANHTNQAISGIVNAAFGSIHLQQQVDLAASEQRVVHFSPNQFPQLRVKHPRVWWPFQYGKPHLERLHVAFSLHGVESDSRSIRFGIREVQAARNAKGFLQFTINRRNILIRGAGWAPDMFYREPRERLQQELAYVRDMNLNTIRLEGKLGSDDMFDLADEMGILIMAGWQCCDFWQHWDKWTPSDHEIAKASLHSQISRLRAHPSLMVWLNGSDETPPPPVETESLDVLKEREWPNPALGSAADRISAVTGPSGVKMSGPYDYVPPEYWYLDTARFGGAFGFNTETGPGPAVPSSAAIRRTLPKESWWPINEQWNFHAALGKFAQYNLFTAAMTASYGEAKDLDDYTRKAQLMTYDGERAMFEGYGANKYTSTGVIQWMLNNAWPAFTWHLYDYYLIPGGGYFGAKKANEPLHIQYRYDTRDVVVVNSTLQEYHGLKIAARLMDVQGTSRFTKESTLDLTADSIAPVFTLPEHMSFSLLRLELRDKSGKLVSNNFYWLPEKLAQMDWDKTTYVSTPAISYPNLQDLSRMSQGHVLVSARTQEPGRFDIRLMNPGKTLAFFLHLRAIKIGTDIEMTPVFWSDNFVSLLPGESRNLSLMLSQGSKGRIAIELEGWNVPRQQITVR